MQACFVQGWVWSRLWGRIWLCAGLSGFTHASFGLAACGPRFGCMPACCAPFWSHARGRVWYAGWSIVLRPGLVAFRGARFECVEVGFMLLLVARRLGRACGDGL